MFEIRESLTLDTLNKAISDIAREQSIQANPKPSVTLTQLISALSEYAFRFDENDKVKAMMREANWIKPGKCEQALGFYSKCRVELLQKHQQTIKALKGHLNEMGDTVQELISVKNQRAILVAQMQGKTVAPTASLDQKMAACRLKPT